MISEAPLRVGSSPRGGALRACLCALAVAATILGCGDSPWSEAGTMVTARAYHTATALDNGQILLAGGTDGRGALAGVELYDPLAGAWRVPPAASRMAVARRDHSATFFLDEGGGHVLVVGGDNGSSALDGVEVYDTAGGAWTPLPALAEARRRHTATLVGSGEPRSRRAILIAGGEGEGGPLRSAALFEGGEWAPAGEMAAPRVGHTATRLGDGPVLIAGGGDGAAALASVERYDPGTGLWSQGVEAMRAARACHTATLLSDGRVLVVGGRSGAGACGGGGEALSSAEIHDPETGAWCELSTGMFEGRAGHTATLLDNGMVLIAGGEGAAGSLSSVELYDPKRPSEDRSDCACDCGGWVEAESLGDARAGHTATRLPDGGVLIAGGAAGAVLGSAEIYRPATQCRTLSDCPAPLICDDAQQCVPPEVTCASGGGAECGPQPSLEGSCSAGGGGPRGAGPFVAAMAGLLLAMVRRRRPGLGGREWRGRSR